MGTDISNIGTLIISRIANIFIMDEGLNKIADGVIFIIDMKIDRIWAIGDIFDRYFSFIGEMNNNIF